jgi:hypothetical protein
MEFPLPLKKINMKPYILSLLVAVSLTACTNYGPKVKKDYLEVYYKKGISKDMAQKALDYIYPLWKKESGNTDKKSIQLEKAGGDTINFRVVVDEKKAKEMGDDTFNVMAILFSDSIFNGAPVNIVFTTDRFKSIRTLVFNKQAVGKFGKKVTIEGTKGEVYYKGDGVTEADAKKLCEYLKNEIHYFTADKGLSVQLMKSENEGYDIRFVVNEKKLEESPEAVVSFEFIGAAISRNLYNNKPVNVFLTDDEFNDLKSLPFDK